MAISKAMRAALHTLSYAANIDVGRTYKVERAADAAFAGVTAVGPQGRAGRA